MRRVASAALCLLAAACAADATRQTMMSLKGQPIEAAIARLGVPHEERTIAGRKVFVWNATRAFDGNDYRCQLRIVMDGPAVGTWEIDGQNAACSVFDAKLSR